MGILAIVTMTILKSFQIIICHKLNFISILFSSFCLFICCYVSYFVPSCILYMVVCPILAFLFVWAILWVWRFCMSHDNCHVFCCLCVLFLLSRFIKNHVFAHVWHFVLSGITIVCDENNLKDVMKLLTKNKLGCEKNTFTFWNL
jgi:hypothetical protein